MTDAIKHIDLDHEDFEDAPKALRDYAAKLKKQLETTQTEVQNLRGSLASRAVADVLGDKGFKNPKRVERDLLADGIDPLDKSAVDGWLSEYGDDYARVTPESSTATPEQDEEAQRLAAAHEQLSAPGELRSAADMSKWELAQSEITSDMNGEQVAAVFKKHGI